jgi:hypothetical protein
LKESIFGYFSEYFGLFWFVSKQFCLFRLFRYRFETPKQTQTNQNFLILVSQNKPKHNRNRSCFGLFWFELIFFCLFQGHPSHTRLNWPEIGIVGQTFMDIKAADGK